MKGDALYVTAPGDSREWQGYVHRVERDEVRAGGGASGVLAKEMKQKKRNYRE